MAVAGGWEVLSREQGDDAQSPAGLSFLSPFRQTRLGRLSSAVCRIVEGELNLGLVTNGAMLLKGLVGLVLEVLPGAIAQPMGNGGG